MTKGAARRPLRRLEDPPRDPRDDEDGDEADGAGDHRVLEQFAAAAFIAEPAARVTPRVAPQQKHEVEPSSAERRVASQFRSDGGAN